MQPQREDKILVNITKDAAAALHKTLETKGLDPNQYGLRLQAQEGGCSGISYGMSIDDNILEGDYLTKQHGIKMMIDKNSISYLIGAKIDYINNDSVQGFKIDNPNASLYCGTCGTCG